MEYKFKEIPLHRLNIPTETLRQSSTNGADESLKKSLDMFGILSPFVVTELGKKGLDTEYAVRDGTRRARLLRDLNFSTKTAIPALVVEGDDQDSLIAQVNINNARERLSEFAEAEALRQLVQDHGMKQVEAAGKLMKSKAWASRVMKVWALPRDILDYMRSGDMPISHAMVIANYADNEALVAMLVEQSLSGDVSQSRLQALAQRALQIGIKKATQIRPRTKSFGQESTLRIETLQKSLKVEIVFSDEDSIEEATEQFIKILTETRKKL